MNKKNNMDINKLEKIIGFKFKDKELLKKSLTHRSFLNENKDEDLKNNERLEFLGDAVLELIISEYLFHNFPERAEGELTSFRAAVVRTENLAKVSKELGIGQHLLMSKGEEMTGGREKEYLLANTFEALVGAMYLDQGYDVVKKFLIENLTPQIATIVKYRLDIDAKTKLQETTQTLFKATPVYKVIKEKGPDHDKVFTVTVMINRKVYGQGEGITKQKAEDAAASQALRKLES
jgi:ribonuclease III